MSRYGVVLDSGCIVRTFWHRKQAKAWKDQHNARAKEQKDRGDLVSLRYAVGIVRHKPVTKGNGKDSRRQSRRQSR